MTDKWQERLLRVRDEVYGGNARRMSLAAGRNPTWVRDTLKIKTTPRAESLQGLADASGIPIHWLLGEGPDEMPGSQSTATGERSKVRTEVSTVTLPKRIGENMQFIAEAHPELLPELHEFVLELIAETAKRDRARKKDQDQSD